MTSEEEMAWRKNLKEGDEVIVNRDYGRRDVACIVTLATPARVEADRLMFWRKNGRRVGADVYNRASICFPDPDRVANAREREVRERLAWWGRTDCQAQDRISISKVRRILAVIDESDEAIVAAPPEAKERELVKMQEKR